MIRIQELKRATSGALKDINNLLPQFSRTAKSLSPKLLESIVADRDNCLIVAKDGNKVVGTGMLIIMRTVVGVHGRIENVVVDGGYRGRGIGEKISRKLIALARKRELRWVELSSRPSRVAANRLYKKLGFKPKHTNVYNLPLQ